MVLRRIQRNGGHGRIKIFGVRADESKARAKRWVEIAKDSYSNLAICPIVFWSDKDVWDFIKLKNIKYCSLYDEGWKRLGCVGCPLAKKENQDREFSRWPNYERNWKNAIIKNWEFNIKTPRRDGKLRYHTNFANGEELWIWWRKHFTLEKTKKYVEECQNSVLWTNSDTFIEDFIVKAGQ